MNRLRATRLIIDNGHLMRVSFVDDDRRNYWRRGRFVNETGQFRETRREGTVNRVTTRHALWPSIFRAVNSARSLPNFLPARDSISSRRTKAPDERESRVVMNHSGRRRVSSVAISSVKSRDDKNSRKTVWHSENCRSSSFQTSPRRIRYVNWP